MTLLKEILKAENRIRPFIRETFLEFSPHFSEIIDGHVLFKLDNQQHTGSFKFRGAMNRVRALSPAENKKGIVTASSGNHGAAVAKALTLFDTPGVVYVPESASPAKIDNMEQYGVEVRLEGDDGIVAELAARQFAEESGKTFISPYNDLIVAAGQGTCGIEIARQLSGEAVDYVFIAVGGGGLISGVACYLKSVWPDVKIIGCQPENSKVMADSIAAGEILDLPSLPTLSDGTAGGIEQGSITFEYNQQYVDEFETVTEEEIADAMIHYMSVHHHMIEGAAGVAVAALLKRKEELQGKSAVVLICGGNISLETLAEVLLSGQEDEIEE
ncbi:MAG: threonine dehydratase [Cellvibrionaceae bacterium]|jgi:threonine dehydratase